MNLPGMYCQTSHIYGNISCTNYKLKVSNLRYETSLCKRLVQDHWTDSTQQAQTHKVHVWCYCSIHKLYLCRPLAVTLFHLSSSAFLPLDSETPEDFPIELCS